MTRTKGGNHNQQIIRYVNDHSLRPPAGAGELADATAGVEHSGMASTPAQCQFLSFVMRAIGAKRAIEVGVFTGVCTLWMADAVGPDGTVVGCDVSDAGPAVGRPLWQRAGVADRIDLRIAPAAETLTELASGQAGTFDFAYVDADKVGYDRYYELLLPLLRGGGVIAFDNMLQGGRVIDDEAQGASVVAIRELNAKLHTDERVDVSFLPLCDGVYLARKR